MTSTEINTHPSHPKSVAQEFLHDLHASIHNTYNICLTLIQMTPPSPKIPQSLYLPHGHLVFCETAIGLPMARVNSPFRRLWTSRFWPFWCEWLGAMTQQATQKESLRRMNIYKGTGRREREGERVYRYWQMCFSKVNETAIALPGLRQKHILLAQCEGWLPSTICPPCCWTLEPKLSQPAQTAGSQLSHGNVRGWS